MGNMSKVIKKKKHNLLQDMPLFFNLLVRI